MADGSGIWFERVEESEDSAVRRVREALAEIRGEVSQSSCGCTFKRVASSAFRHRGCVVAGDVLIRFCARHEWEHSLPLTVARQLNRQRREEKPS